MQQLLCFLFLFSITKLLAQEEIKTTKSPMIAIDSLYREDQFYFGITINSLQNKFENLSKNKISTGFSVGFLRDMPVNKTRTLAVAPGLGLMYNNYIQNITISSTQTTTYNTNRFSQLFVEVPIELRWRNSTYESYKFWRVYGGMKLSYLLYNNFVFDGNGVETVETNNNDFDKFQYGVYLATGYNTINLYAYYGLNSLFKTLNNQEQRLDLKAFNVGIIFYIL
jgi:hypothetical protein